MTEPFLYSVQDIPALTGLGRTVIYREMRSGRLGSVKVGRRRLVPRSALESFVQLLAAEAGQGR